MNILMLGGAKRVSMARLLKKAAEGLGTTAAIFSYEMSELVPIASEGTVIVGKRWRDPDVVEHLLECVEKYAIDIVLPFVDGAVAVSANLVDEAHERGISLFSPVSDAEMAERMFDKVLAATMFERLGLPIPRTYHEGDPCMQLIAKPRHGSASKGIVSINSLEGLQRVMDHAADYLIQERIDNRIEYTVDCYVSMADGGRILAAVPRRRLEVSGGEVTTTVTVDEPDVEALARRTLQATGLRGAVTVQIIRDLDMPTEQSPMGKLMIMEINPRLGGGAVCSVHAGADIPKMILQEAAGEQAGESGYTPGTMITRYPCEVVFHT